MQDKKFNPFDEEITDFDVEESPKKSLGKITTITIIGLVLLGFLTMYLIQNSNLKQVNLGVINNRTNYTKDGIRYLINPDKPGSKHIVDLSIKEVEFDGRGISKDGVSTRILLNINYWPNQNYLDYQHEYIKRTENYSFHTFKLLRDFLREILPEFINQYDFNFLTKNMDETQSNLQSLIDEKNRKAFVFEYFDGGRNERLVEYLDVDEVNTEVSLESKMFERNKWGNNAYLVESTEDYKKYFIIDDFIRIGSVKIIDVEVVE